MPKLVSHNLLTLFQQGGWCDDFLSHFMCCCCALVQELREVEIRQIHGMFGQYSIVESNCNIYLLHFKFNHFVKKSMYHVICNGHCIFAGPQKSRTSAPPFQYMEPLSE